MILELFFVLIFLVVALVFIGYFFSAEFLSVVGFTFLFVLSMVIVSGNITYVVGDNLNITENSTDNTTSISRVYVYENFNETTCKINQINTGCEHLIGYFLAVVSVAGFVHSFSIVRPFKKKKEEDEE